VTVGKREAPQRALQACTTVTFEAWE
jgi:hypothetical protein